MLRLCRSCGHPEYMHRGGGLCDLCIPGGHQSGASSTCQVFSPRDPAAPRFCSSLLWTGFLLGKKQTLSKAAVIEALTTLRPLDDWHEDFGPVLWWTNPVTEPPYVGCPLSSDWPGYHTHWTPFLEPA